MKNEAEDRIARYRSLIFDMIRSINDERFLRKIYTIIVKHTEKGGV